MTAIFNRPFDLFFGPFESLHPAVGLTVLSVLTGVLLLVVYRFTSNQEGIRKAKDLIKAHFLEVRLFQDQIGVVVGAHWRILRATGVYMSYSLKPLAVILLPVLILMVQMEMHLGQAPLELNRPVLIKASLADEQSLGVTSLELPPEIVLDAPPVRMAELAEINWRVVPTQEGRFQIGVRVGEEVFEKSVVVGSGAPRISPVRWRGNLIDNFFYPSEEPLPASGPVDSITVNFPPRTVDLWLFDTYWMVGFFVLSIVAGVALKGVMGTEL